MPDSPKIVLFEQGTSGVRHWSGFVDQAYNQALKWPSVQPLYSRLRRSDPDISPVRYIFASLIRGASIHWEGPENPTPGDEAALEFAESIGEDIVGGWDEFLETVVSHVPFMGFGWWTVVPALRKAGWTDPDKSGWQSQFDDGHIGIRKIAFRDSSSFYRWEYDTANKNMVGMWQFDVPNPMILLPLENSLHITFGDPGNPEGLSPLEAVWRLERIKYGLEVIQGIGFEHAAGYLSVTAENTLSPADQVAVEKAARAILSAQEGNYAAWPKGVTGEVKDIPFAAASSILEAIRYYGMQKLTVFIAQWMAMATTSGKGSFAAMSDSSLLFMIAFNSMLDGFAKQFDEQVGKRLFTWNAFPGMTKRPRFTILPVSKITLAEIAAVLPALQAAVHFGPEDEAAIRTASGFLPPLADLVSQQDDSAAPSDAGPSDTTPNQPNQPVAPASGDKAIAAQADLIARATRLILRYPNAH